MAGEKRSTISAGRSYLLERPGLILLASLVILGAGILMDSAFTRGVGIGVLLTIMIKIIWDRARAGTNEKADTSNH